jgi:hypothetical protein
MSRGEQGKDGAVECGPEMLLMWRQQQQQQGKGKEKTEKTVGEDGEDPSARTGEYIVSLTHVALVNRRRV